MDDSIIYLKGLVERYLTSAQDEANFDRLVEEYKEKSRIATDRRYIFEKALKTEGIDPENIPHELLPFDVSPIHEEAGEAVHPQESTEQPPQITLLPQNNGHSGKKVEIEEPINRTHALFLTFKRLGNKGYTPEELSKASFAYGYNLSKEEISRIIGRQTGRGMIEREGGKYNLTLDGYTFDKFRKKDLKGADAPEAQAKFMEELRK
jgi:hypothetical protein